MAIEAVGSATTALSLFKSSGTGSTAAGTQSTADTTTITTASDGAVTTTVTAPNGTVVSVTITQPADTQNQAPNANTLLDVKV